MILVVACLVLAGGWAVLSAVTERPAGTPVIPPWPAMPGGVPALLAVAAIVGLCILARQAVERERRIAAALRRANAELEAVAREHRQARCRAEAASAAKSRLLASVTHDLSQPVRALLFRVEAGVRESVDPAMRARFACMQEIARLQQDMLDQLVHASVLESGRLTPVPQCVPLAPILERVCALYAGEVADKGIGLRLVRTSLWVHNDPVLLSRIILNLITNAVRHTRSGRVLVGCRHGEDALRIEVWDTGPGIPADEIEAIFDEFRRGSGAAAGDGRLGLGLCIVRRTADLLGFGIRVRSQVGRGSCFAVTLPWSCVSDGSTETSPQAIRSKVAQKI
ncbi:sensor histidine kinase [Azospirillum halopraeferens]|uniref:sensor histidine kinase n=1 Tax=Azospirillum halopraeferens TaxID=34010 RepID=UPI0004169A56|nr:HAMP domain-containing sensor histidine kinase [Azospirillum halopraeferens]